MVHAEARTYFLENFEIPSPQIRRPMAATLSSLRSPNARNKFAFALGDRKLLATLKFPYLKLGGQGAATLSSLRSPNARNKFAFALGDRKLLATLKFLNLKLDGQGAAIFFLMRSILGLRLHSCRFSYGMRPCHPTAK
jgi:hypothetical protein